MVEKQNKEVPYERFDIRARLAQIFELPYDHQMQDWAYEIAHPSLIEPLLEYYNLETTLDEERGIIAEILMQSFDDLGQDLAAHDQWPNFLRCLDKNRVLHEGTLEYWSRMGDTGVDIWFVTPYIRALLDVHLNR